MENSRPTGYGSTQHLEHSGENDSGNQQQNDNLQTQMTSGLHSNPTPASWQPNPLESSLPTNLPTPNAWQTYLMQNAYQTNLMQNAYQTNLMAIAWQRYLMATAYQTNVMAPAWQTNLMVNTIQHNTMTQSWPPNIIPNGLPPSTVAPAWQPEATARTWPPLYMPSSSQLNLLDNNWQQNTLATGLPENPMAASFPTNSTPTGSSQLQTMTTGQQPSTMENRSQPEAMEIDMQQDAKKKRNQRNTVDPAMAAAAVSSSESCPPEVKTNTNQPLASMQGMVESLTNKYFDTHGAFSPVNLDEPKVWCMQPKHILCEICFPPREIRIKDVLIHNVNQHMDGLLASANILRLSMLEFENCYEYIFKKLRDVVPEIRDRYDNPLLRCQNCEYSCYPQLEMRYHLYTKHKDLLITKLVQMHQLVGQGTHVTEQAPQLDHVFCNECRPRCQIFKKNVTFHKIIHHIDVLLISSKISTVSIGEFKQYCEMVIQNHIILLKKKGDGVGKPIFACQLCSYKCYERSQMRIHVTASHEKILRQELLQMQPDAAAPLAEQTAMELNPGKCKYICEDCIPPRALLKKNEDRHNAECHIEKLFISVKSALMSNLEFKIYCEKFFENEIASCKQTLNVIGWRWLECPICSRSYQGKARMQRHLVSAHRKSLQERIARSHLRHNLMENCMQRHK